MTLWGLAQSWPHEWINEEGDYVHAETELFKADKFDPNCHRCQLEQWAREKVKSAQIEMIAIKNRAVSRQDLQQVGLDLVTLSEGFYKDLGVPEESEGEINCVCGHPSYQHSLKYGCGYLECKCEAYRRASPIRRLCLALD